MIGLRDEKSLANPGLSYLLKRRATTARAPVENELRVRLVGIALCIVDVATQLV